jgi:hypothetical protein
MNQYDAARPIAGLRCARDPLMNLIGQVTDAACHKTDVLKFAIQ